MLVSADKFYGVLFNNQKISSIRSIKKEEAMEFVDQVRIRMGTSSPCLKFEFAPLGSPGTLISNIVRGDIFPLLFVTMLCTSVFTIPKFGSRVVSNQFQTRVIACGCR